MKNINIRVFRIENKKTNELLERLCKAVERLSPDPPDTEISEVVIDETDNPRNRDESEGLDAVRKELGKSF